MITHAAILLQMLDEIKDTAQGTMTYPEKMVYLGILRELRYLKIDTEANIYYHPVDTFKTLFMDVEDSDV